jgi:hypothetical protein
MKIVITPQQHANLLDALHVMWPSVPPENVARGFCVWSTTKFKATCKTIACFGGWCAEWPSFRDQGVRRDSRSGGPRIPGYYGEFEVSEVLFGFRDLFVVRGQHPADKLGRTDHQTVSDRLRWCLKRSTVA